MSEQPKEWWKTHPKSYVKNDLHDLKLKALADRPPQSTNKSGLFELTLIVTESMRKDFEPSTLVKTLVTNRDLAAIIDATCNNHSFQFIKKSGDWADVVEDEYI